MNLRYLALAIVPVLLWAACSSGSGEPTGTMTDTPTVEGTPSDEVTAVPTDTPATEELGGEPTPPPGNPAIDAVTAYVAQAGFDGQTYEISEPLNCKGIVSVEDREAANGKVCIHFAGSSFEEASGSVETWLFGSDRIWTLTLQKTDGVWSVTSVKASTQPLPGEEPLSPTPQG